MCVCVLRTSGWGGCREIKYLTFIFPQIIIYSDVFTYIAKDKRPGTQLHFQQFYLCREKINDLKQFS